MHVTQLTSDLLMLFGVQEKQLPIAPVTQFQQGILIHCFTCFLVEQRDLQKPPGYRKACAQLTGSVWPTDSTRLLADAKVSQCVRWHALFPQDLCVTIVRHKCMLSSSSELARQSSSRSMQHQHRQTIAQHFFHGQAAQNQACSAVLPMTVLPSESWDATHRRQCKEVVNHKDSGKPYCMQQDERQFGCVV